MAWFKSNTAPERTSSDPFLEIEPLRLPGSAAEPVPAPALGVSEPTPAPAAASRAADPAPPAATSATVRPTSVLGPTLRFRGELRADEDFTLQGRIEGSIHHTQTLTIGADGVVKGDSRARTLVVEGTVEGDLYALESISVRATARVLGNLFAPRVSIADGAIFNGKIDMASATKAARAIAERQSATALTDRDAEQVLSGS